MRLLTNLLDISKSEEGKLEPKRAAVDLHALVAEVFDALGVRARARNIRLTSSAEALSVHADADLLRRVLENLLENALRHAPEDSVVTVRGARRDGAVELEVADTGPGVPAGLRETIFDRFVRVESGDGAATRSGRGLGLAFCRLAVEAHGGSIRVEDGTPGAVFRLSLPDDAR
jgi:signal transduction histidine kinase